MTLVLVLRTCRAFLDYNWGISFNVKNCASESSIPNIPATSQLHTHVVFCSNVFDFLLMDHDRTPEGDMFVVKDPDVFASTVIPQYFDHNKFSSFARQVRKVIANRRRDPFFVICSESISFRFVHQLNFYGFRKMQSKPIRNSDFDANTAKHVTFFNENFKRGRCDLLKKIQRSTRGGGSTPGQDQQREVEVLRNKISSLEETINEMSTQMEERMRRLELDMLGRMEQMMLAMQQQQQTQLQIQNVGSNGPAPATSNPNVNAQKDQQPAWDPLPFGARAASFGARGTSIGSITSGLGGFVAPAPVQGLSNGNGNGGGPTLPPHPKMKQLGQNQGLPGALDVPPGRFTSLRGISNLSRGISGLSRGASIESQSSVLLRNAWEDKFFSMLMLGENEQAAQAQAQLNNLNNLANLDSMHPTPMADRVVGFANGIVNNRN